ncbi:hypothetical protein NB2BOR_A18880 [Bordetella parapertussis]|nr:hypothetical protein NB2BOR_A18880 [Bordetella parapertussis]
MNTAANTPPLSDQVVDWLLLLLRSGQATRTDYARFLAWRNENPMNENAWQQLTGTLAGANTGRLGDAYPTGYDGADQAPPAELPAETLAMPARRHFLSSVGALALGGAGLAAAAYVGNSFYPLNALAADAATNTGERRRYMLSDGSELAGRPQPGQPGIHGHLPAPASARRRRLGHGARRSVPPVLGPDRRRRGALAGHPLHGAAAGPPHAGGRARE